MDISADDISRLCKKQEANLRMINKLSERGHWLRDKLNGRRMVNGYKGGYGYDGGMI